MRARVISFFLGAGLILLLHFCGRVPGLSDRGPDRGSDTIVRTDTLFDTIQKKGLPLVTEKKEVSEPRLPGPDTVRDTVRDTIRDTARVFRDYFRRRSYLKSYEDSSLSSSVFIRVSRNRLDSVSFSYSLIQETKIRDRVINKDPLSIYAGATVTPRSIAPGIFAQKGNFIGGLGYSTRGRVILTAGVRVVSF